MHASPKLFSRVNFGVQKVATSIRYDSTVDFKTLLYKLASSDGIDKKMHHNLQRLYDTRFSIVKYSKSNPTETKIKKKLGKMISST